MNVRRTKMISGTLIGLLLAFQNCAKFESGYATMKTKVLSSSSVLGGRIPVTGEPTDPNTPRPPGSEDTDPKPPVIPPVKPPVTPPPPKPIPDTTASFTVPYYCGSLMSVWVGYTLKTANEPLKLTFLENQPIEDFLSLNGRHDQSHEPDSQLSDLKPKCEINDPALTGELANGGKKLNIRNLAKTCPTLAPGVYTLTLNRASQTRNLQRNLLIGAGGAEGFSKKSIQAQWAGQTYSFIDFVQMQSRVLATVTRNGDVLDVSIQSSGPFFPEVLNDVAVPHGGTNCDTTYSPLVVQFNQTPVLLGDPKQGVMFDIQGLLASPAAFTKYLISWIVPQPDLGTYFVALPNDRGQVNGIDELFGDHTQGPDANDKFAVNGYEALRKWDGRRADGRVDESARDGFITAADAVFPRLRFWRDANFDGVASPSELFTAEEMKVQSIDLAADGRFPEIDGHGNVVTLKSLLKTTDGVQHVMYDVYFVRPKP